MNEGIFFLLYYHECIPLEDKREETNRQRMNINCKKETKEQKREGEREKVGLKVFERGNGEERKRARDRGENE